MLLIEVLQGTGFEKNGSAADFEVGRVTDDSRSVKKGDMFVALKGYAADGYGFIDQASWSGG